MCVTFSIQKNEKAKKNSKKFINTFSFFLCRGWEHHYLHGMRAVEMGTQGSEKQ